MNALFWFLFALSVLRVGWPWLVGLMVAAIAMCLFGHSLGWLSAVLFIWVLLEVVAALRSGPPANSERFDHTRYSGDDSFTRRR